MLQLMFSTLKDSLLQVIIPLLLTQANLEYREVGILDSQYVCQVQFHDSYFFVREINWENGFVPIEKNDSFSLTKKFEPYLSKYQKIFLWKMAQSNFYEVFLLFHHGRLWRDKNGIRIDVALRTSNDTIKFGVFKDETYLATSITVPFINFIGEDSLTNKLYERVGQEKFMAIMVFLHEINHFKDYLYFKKNHPGKKIPKFFKSEYETDLDAIQMLHTFWEKIEFIVRKE